MLSENLEMFSNKFHSSEFCDIISFSFKIYLKDSTSKKLRLYYVASYNNRNFSEVEFFESELKEN